MEGKPASQGFMAGSEPPSSRVLLHTAVNSEMGITVSSKPLTLDSMRENFPSCEPQIFVHVFANFLSSYSINYG